MSDPCGPRTKQNSFCSAALDVHRDLRRAAKMTMATMMIVRPAAAVLRGAAVLRDAGVLRGAAPMHVARKDAVAAMSEPLEARGEVDSQADLADFQVVVRE